MRGGVVGGGARVVGGGVGGGMTRGAKEGMEGGSKVGVLTACVLHVTRSSLKPV